MEQAEIINAETRHSYASFWRRLAAYAIDGSIIGLIMAPLAIMYIKSSGLWDLILAFQTAKSSGFQIDDSGMGMMVLLGSFMQTIVIISLCSMTIHILYYSIWESSKFQGTPGKMVSHLKVVNENGERISFLHALARNFLKILSGAILCIGYIMILVTEKRQSLHDKIAGCYVLKTSYEVPHMQSTEYAGFWRRFLAFLLDIILISLLISPLKMFVLAGTQSMWDVWLHNIKFPAQPIMPSIDELIREAWISFVTSLLTIFYFASFESSRFQATPGKIAIGIRVTDTLGQRLSFWRAAGRYMAKYISNLTLLIGYIMAGFTPKAQALHDELADTLVVKSQVPKA